MDKIVFFPIRLKKTVIETVENQKLHTWTIKIFVLVPYSNASNEM